jgi:hypothetical protein
MDPNGLTPKEFSDGDAFPEAPFLWNSSFIDPPRVDGVAIELSTLEHQDYSPDQGSGCIHHIHTTTGCSVIPPRIDICKHQRVEKTTEGI